MAHFLIFDSSATVDNRGEALDQSLAPLGSVGAAVRTSKAVRLFGPPDGDIRHVGFEFNMLGPVDVSLDVQIRWRLQFFNDRIGAPSAAASNAPGQYRYQSAPDAWRDAPIIGYRNLAWASECVEIVGGAGAIAHYPATRLVTLNPGTGGDESGCPNGLDSVYFPMNVHAMWVRLAVWQAATDTALPTTDRLLIFAVVGGYTLPKLMEQSTTPWAGGAAGILGES